MANRPVFLPDSGDSLVREVGITFDWFPGFSVAQKQRSIAGLHEAGQHELGVSSILEVSTKSPDLLGTRLSAFNLELESEIGTTSVEAAFQGSKVYQRSGQHPELYRLRSGREVKRALAEFAGEPLVSFRFADEDWPLSPKTAFYDWLYLTALTQEANAALRSELGRYEAFTDIEFNPARSVNCQARSCALYLALERRSLLTDALRSSQAFRDLLGEFGYQVEPKQDRLF